LQGQVHRSGSMQQAHALGAFQPWTVLFVAPTEQAISLRAGETGTEFVMLQFGQRQGEHSS